MICFFGSFFRKPEPAQDAFLDDDDIMMKQVEHRRRISGMKEVSATTSGER